MPVDLVAADHLKTDVRFRPHFLANEVSDIALAQIKKWMLERHGVVVYQNAQMDSSQCGDTSFCPRMMDTVEKGMQPAIKWLHDLPSQRQYPIDWIKPGATEAETAELVDICFYTIEGRKGARRRVRPLSKLPAPPCWPDREKLLAKTCSVPITKGGQLVGLASIDLSHYAEDPYGVWVARIFTTEGHRGEGFARIGMRGLCHAADETGVTLYISPNSYGPMKKRDLVAWWKRLGFKKKAKSDICYVRYPRWKDPA